MRPIARARSRLDSRSSLEQLRACAPRSPRSCRRSSSRCRRSTARSARACAFISGLDRNASRSHGVRRSAETVARLTRPWSQWRSLRRVRDHEVGADVADDLVEPAHQLVHRDVLDAARLVVEQDEELGVDDAAPAVRLGVALLDVVRDRDDRHRDARRPRAASRASSPPAPTSRSSGWAPNASTRPPSSSSRRFMASVLPAMRRSPVGDRMSRLAGPQLKSRSRKPRCGTKPSPG